MAFDQTKQQWISGGQCKPENLLGVCVHIEQKSVNTAISTDSEGLDSYSSGELKCLILYNFGN